MTYDEFLLSDYGKLNDSVADVEPDPRLVKKLIRIFIRQGEDRLDAEDLAEGCAEELTYYMNEGDFNGVEDVLYEYGLDLDYVEDLIL